jgi:hypothetical protein
MSGTTSSTCGAKSIGSEIGFAINARWHTFHANAVLHGDEVWVSVPPGLSPTALRAIVGIVSRCAGAPHVLAETQDLDRRVRLIYRPAADVVAEGAA